MHFAEKKVFIVFVGVPFKPLKHTLTFFRQMSLTFMKNTFAPNSRMFSQKYAHDKKERNFCTARSSNFIILAKFCPMLVATPYSGRVINPKTYLNHESGSKFVFLSSLAYKLVNLLVFEKNACKMSNK